MSKPGEQTFKKATHEEAEYSDQPGAKGEMCISCRRFQPGQHRKEPHCVRVEDPIRSFGYCKKYFTEQAYRYS
jgi:hypothetical protein